MSSYFREGTEFLFVNAGHDVGEVPGGGLALSRSLPRLPPLPRQGMGGEARGQVRRGLSALQARAALLPRLLLGPGSEGREGRGDVGQLLGRYEPRYGDGRQGTNPGEGRRARGRKAQLARVPEADGCERDSCPAVGALSTAELNSAHTKEII